MKPNTTSVDLRGNATITLGGTAYPISFGMLVMRDFSKLTGRAPSDFGNVLSEDYITAFGSLVYCAIKRYVPADKLPEGFNEEAALELIDAMAQEEADVIAAAILYAVTTANPLVASFTAQTKARNEAAAPTKNGKITSTSASGN